MIDFYAAAKKVTTTQKPDQEGNIVKHVQIILEVEVTPEDDLDLRAIQDTACVHVIIEPRQPAAQASDAPDGGLAI